MTVAGGYNPATQYMVAGTPALDGIYVSSIDMSIVFWTKIHGKLL
jgi:hypothetical protein